VRRDMGMTQAEFAALTDIGEKRIAAWESGKNPRPDDIEVTARQLEATTGVDRLWWIGWAIDADPNDTAATRRKFACYYDGTVRIGPWPDSQTPRAA
jgi:transcriptional regulator with XRE-family HTH domain